MNLNKKNCFIICATLLLFLLLSNIFAYSTTNIKPTYGVTTENVNLRFNTTVSSSSRVKTVPKDTAVKIVGTLGNFNIVQLRTNEVGLISKDYIKATQTPPEGAKTYQNLSKFYGSINENYVALRGGPSTNFKVYKRLSSGDKIEVIGKIDDFYMIVTEDNNVGMVRQDFVNETSAVTPEETEVETILRLINAERAKDNKPALVLDDNLTKVAQTKADDMVKNNYFAHNSPTYGSPFKMMQDFGISYKVAGENIAGNPSIKDAVDSWMQSESHRKNILSNIYNYVGIGVANSKTYGYVIVLMFIGK